MRGAPDLPRGGLTTARCHAARMPVPMVHPRLRTILGLLLAALSVGLVLPEWLTPLARWLGQVCGGAIDPLAWLQSARTAIAALGLGASWPVLPALVSMGLLLSCWCIPPAPAPPRRPSPVIRDETAMAVGALLLAEPLMHL